MAPKAAKSWTQKRGYHASKKKPSLPVPKIAALNMNSIETPVVSKAIPRHYIEVILQPRLVRSMEKRWTWSLAIHRFACRLGGNHHRRANYQPDWKYFYCPHCGQVLSDDENSFWSDLSLSNTAKTIDDRLIRHTGENNAY